MPATQKYNTGNLHRCSEVASGDEIANVLEVVHVC